MGKNGRWICSKNTGNTGRDRGYRYKQRSLKTSYTGSLRRSRCLQATAKSNVPELVRLAITLLWATTWGRAQRLSKTIPRAERILGLEQDLQGISPECRNLRH